MAIPNKVNVGQLALTGSAQQLPQESGAQGGFILKALAGNTDPLYLGEDSTVTSTSGFELGPGERVPIEILSLSRVWVIGTAADRVSWITMGSGV